ncbi:hypothetical protein DPX39_070060300 [Trypanosoma brucei equiperdum]|uniref:Uncharacterized protein n=1 Tax=Trypanosoma brucei equiperdum TaxID=630700 RepID=A0A3L6L7D3_9TRYP|nr:hypothetical protein DPX39_070060300 [Trypanosoma brucei equiperdum]
MSAASDVFQRPLDMKLMARSRNHHPAAGNAQNPEGGGSKLRVRRNGREDQPVERNAGATVREHIARQNVLGEGNVKLSQDNSDPVIKDNPTGHKESESSRTRGDKAPGPIPLGISHCGKKTEVTVARAGGKLAKGSYPQTISGYPRPRSQSHRMWKEDFDRAPHAGWFNTGSLKPRESRRKQLIGVVLSWQLG